MSRMGVVRQASLRPAAVLMVVLAHVFVAPAPGAGASDEQRLRTVL